MTFERTTDYDLVREVMTNEYIWPWITDDHAPNREGWEPYQGEGVMYVLVRDGEELLGLWMFVQRTVEILEVHTCLLKTCGYARGRVASREMSEWIFNNTECVSIRTECPSYNTQAIKFAKAAGMQQIGVQPMAYRKSGKLHDLILLFLSKCEVPTKAEGMVVQCQQQ